MSLVAISPSNDPDWVTALLNLGERGLYPGAVLIDSGSFGGDEANTGLREILAVSGVTVRTVAKGQEFDTIRAELGVETYSTTAPRSAYAIARASGVSRG